MTGEQKQYEVPETCIREALAALDLDENAPLEDMTPARRNDVLRVARYLDGQVRAREDWRGVRVLRLIEYVYPDTKTMQEDMGRWLVVDGLRSQGLVRIRSTVLPLEVLD